MDEYVMIPRSVWESYKEVVQETPYHPERFGSAFEIMVILEANMITGKNISRNKQ